MLRGHEGSPRSSVLCCTQRESIVSLFPSSPPTTIERRSISETNLLTNYQRKKEITAQPYYHGNLRSKEEVKKFLWRAERGEFLLRDSFSEIDSFTFSLAHETGVKHMRLNCGHDDDDGSSYSLKDQLFTSIQQLVLYYSTNPIPNSDNLPDVFLSKPILRNKPIVASPDDDSWDYINPISLTTNHRPPKCHDYDYNIRNVDEMVMMEGVPCSLESMKLSGREMHDCGLEMDAMELPMGWSVHLTSQEDPGTPSGGGGGIYFVSPEGDAVWDLPLNVCLDLSSDQQEIIRRLMQDASDLRWTSSA